LTFYADRSYGGVLTIGDPRVVADGHVFRFAPGRHVVTRIDRRKRWSQEGRRVSCRSFFGEHFAGAPTVDRVRTELAALGVEVMSPADEHELRSVARVFWPEKFT
jgi:hypothetical protein